MADEKKHKSGFALLKEKIAKLETELAAKDQRIAGLTLNVESEVKKAKQSAEAERDRWKKDAEAKQTTIEQQSRKISQLTADLHSSETLRLNADNAHSKKEGEMLRAMGPIRRWWWNLHHLPTFKEDERWNETH